MTDLETRLRDALREAAETVEPSPVALADVEPRRPRRRHRWAVAPIAVAAIVALVVATIALWPTHDDRVHVTGGPAGPVAFVPTGLGTGWTVTHVAGSTLFGPGYACTDGSYAGGHLTCRAMTGTIQWFARRADLPGVAVLTTLGDDRAVLDAMRGRGGGRSVPISVRGHPGERITATDTTLLTWQERPAVRVTVIVPSGSGVDAVRVVDGLRATAAPVDAVPLVVATVDDASLAVRPADAGTVCFGIVVGGDVQPCQFSTGDVVTALSYRGRNLVYGTFDSPAVTTVRITVGEGITLADAHRVAGIRGTFFVGAVPSSDDIRRVDALDASGGTVTTISGAAITGTFRNPNSSTKILIERSAPVVATTPSGARLQAMWANGEICVGVEDRGAIVQSACAPAYDVGSIVQATSTDYVFGAVSEGVAKVRAQPTVGEPTTVGVHHDDRFPFGFYVISLPPGNTGYDLTMLDANGNVVGSATTAP